MASIWAAKFSERKAVFASARTLAVRYRHVRRAPLDAPLKPSILSGLVRPAAACLRKP
jgi:hypothetical protein